MIKVMIVDDQELIRQSLKIVLGVNSDMEVVCMTGDGDETLRKLREMRPESRPDVILMDIRMPVMDGVECTALIKKNYPDIKVIALTTFDDNEFIFRTVQTGGAMLNPTVANTVIRQFSTMAQNIVSPELSDLNTDEITKSEWYIIQAVARGMSNKEIAETLWLSQGTVRNSISSILNKLHLRDRTQLAIWAIQTGVVNKDLFDI